MYIILLNLYNHDTFSTKQKMKLGFSEGWIDGFTPLGSSQLGPVGMKSAHGE